MSNAGNLAYALKQERNRQGMSISELSDKTGLSTSLISMIERGGRNVTLRTLAMFEEALSTQLAVFYDLPLDAEEWKLLIAWRKQNHIEVLQMCIDKMKDTQS